jgi:hypothetical protein
MTTKKPLDWVERLCVVIIHIFSKGQLSMLTNDVLSNVSIPPTNGKAATAADPFDLSRLRLSQDFVAAAGVKKILNTVPVRKPSKEWFIQTHPDTGYRFQTCVVELKEDSETYLVDSSLWHELASESTFSPRALITTMNRQGVLFLWPIRLPGADGRLDEWSRSAMEAATHATGNWVRVQANMSLGAYEIYEAAGQWATPEWPDMSFQDLFQIAFKDKFITAHDHPVLKRLRGEA